MATSLTLKFCYLEIYDDYMTVVMNEGVTVVQEITDTLIDIANKNFNNKNFVYITIRKHSYAVNPLVYKKTSQIKNLVGMAVVSSSPFQIHQINVEKAFMDQEIRCFQTMEKALEWKNDLLNSLG